MKEKKHQNQDKCDLSMQPVTKVIHRGFSHLKFWSFPWFSLRNAIFYETNKRTNCGVCTCMNFKDFDLHYGDVEPMPQLFRV